MFATPTTILLILSRPPTTRPVYDIPPVIVSSVRWRTLRTLATRVARIAPDARETLPVGVGPDLHWRARLSLLAPGHSGKSRSARRARRCAADGSLAMQSRSARSSRTR
jgi:hypothetical protein